MDRRAVNVWVHRHRLDSYHVSIAAVTVTQVLILLLNQMIFGKFKACVSGFFCSIFLTLPPFIAPLPSFLLKLKKNLFQNIFHLN